MPRRVVGLLCALALVFLGALAAAAAGGRSTLAGLAGSLAGRCVALQAAERTICHRDFRDPLCRKRASRIRRRGVLRQADRARGR